mmetsp:Transcript_32015/g.67303  ORF Transcript_32015/g.67303 Transcript_32015/m.67303 type:complete len:98 (+) Transcript_32015:30-323(+)
MAVVDVATTLAVGRRLLVDGTATRRRGFHWNAEVLVKRRRQAVAVVSLMMIGYCILACTDTTILCGENFFQAAPTLDYKPRKSQSMGEKYLSLAKLV